MASTITVTNTNDSGANSLRNAIANASTGDTIQFSVTGTITLTSGTLSIGKSLIFTGPGANVLTVSGNHAYTVFTVSSGTVAISGLTIANGNGSSGGGGIYNLGTLTASNCVFSGNSAPSDQGGGIYNNGTLTVSNSTFSGNSAGSDGGVIYNLFSATLTVSNSTFSSNFSATRGGGIVNSGTVTVSDSTFFGNSAIQGGAIFNSGSGTLTVNNSTFSGNSATFRGGGISNPGGTANASYNVFWNNLANGVEDDCNGCTSNNNATNLDPKLAPLGNYGGPTPTMLPQPGSAAICAGSAADVPSGVTTDQRGWPLSPSTCPSGYVDAGAVQTNYLTVTTTTDSDDGGSCTSTTCSLRDAINAANTVGYGDIDFAPGLTGTITLGSALPAINRQLNLIGPGANLLTVSGNNDWNVGSIFTVNSGKQALISGLTIANGISNNGGGIYNQGTLTVSNSAFSGNSNQGNGGGAIFNDFGSTLTVSNSTFSGNSADAGTDGGAIFNDFGSTLTVSNSTFSGNSASGGSFDGGGGIVNAPSATLTVSDSTFSGNSASSSSGGGIVNFGTLTVGNSTFSGNSAGWGGGIFNFGTANASYNVFWNNIRWDGSEDDCNSCNSNNNAISADPKLAPLGNYGGPTQTMLPQPGSSAICAGSTALILSGPATDQRGFARTTTYSGTPCVDASAVQTKYQSVQFTNVPGAGNYSGIVNQTVSPAPVVSVTENGQNIGSVPVTLNLSGTGTPTGLGPVTTVGGTGAAFGSLSVNAAGNDTLSVNLPITASGNAVQPSPLIASASLNITALATDFQLITGGGASTAITSATVQPGGLATFQFQVSPLAGATFASAVSFTLTGLPAGATYTITPNPIPAGSTATTVVVQVQTSLSAALRKPLGGGMLFALALLPMFGLVRLRCFGQGRTKFRALVLLSLLVIALWGMWGGGGGSGYFNRTAQTYPVQLSATNGTVTHSATLTMTVQ